MTVYLVLLRGVNVGGLKLPMADLRRISEQCGYADPRTYIQSGNLLIAATGESAVSISRRLRQVIKGDLGLDIGVVVRTHAELKRIIDSNPFIKAGEDPQRQSVVFFGDKVDEDLFAGDDLAQFAPEAAAIRGHEIYLNLPLGTGHSPMLKVIGRRQGLKIGTMRNWRTVTNLLAMADESSAAR